MDCLRALATPADVRFPVVRLNWRWGVDGWVKLPGTIPVADFPSADEAEAYRRRREADARRKVNPFDCGPLADVFVLPEPILRDWLQDAAIDPPDPGDDGTADRDTWAGWWLRTRPRLSADQQARVWDATRLRFYDAPEPEPGPFLWAVVEVPWQDNGDWLFADADGGRLAAVFPDFERAAADVNRRNREARAPFADPHRAADLPAVFDLQRPIDVVDPFGVPVPDPLTPNGPLRSADEVPFAEVLAVPIDRSANPAPRLFDPGPPVFGRRVFVAVRRAWEVDEAGLGLSDNADGIPVRAFADPGDADAWCDHAERVAKTGLHPFRLSRRPDDLTGWSDLGFARAARAAGLPAPADGDWRTWWDVVVDVRQEARAAAWGLFEKVRFFEVRALDVDDTATTV